MKLFGSIKELVAAVLRKDSQEITVRPNQSTTYTAARDVQLPPGDTNHVLVSASSSQTLTGKTIDGDDNTLSDIAVSSLKTVLGDANEVILRDGAGAVTSALLSNANVDAAAAIARTKLASGTASHVIINNGSGVLSSEAALAASRGGLATDASAFTGVLKAVAGSFSASSIVNADVSASAAIDATKIADGSVSNTEFQYINTLTSNAQTQLDNKQPLDADLTAIAALASTGILARTAANTYALRTISAGSAKISITNGDGVSGNPSIDVSEASLTLDNIGGTLSISKGGTGQTSQTAAFDALAPTTTKGDLIAHNGSDNIRVAVGVDGQVLTADSGAASGLSWSSPLVNPMDSAGDLIVGGLGGAATKLDSGTANYVLQANGAAAPSWVLIDNDNVDAAAAIAGTKISPNFGSQAVSTTGNLTIDTDTLHVDATNNTVGIGTASPSTTAKLVVVSSGSVPTPSAAANEATFTDTGASGSGITIISANNQVGSLFFGDTDDADIGGIRYSHIDNSLVLRANNASGATMTSEGRFTAGNSHVIARRATDQTIGANTANKLEINVEDVDSRGEYDPTTNYRFTAAVAGLYKCTAIVRCEGQTNNSVFDVELRVNNTAGLHRASGTNASGGTRNTFACVSTLLNLAASDFVEVVVTGETNASKNYQGRLTIEQIV